MQEQQLDRKNLIEYSIKRLAEQTKDIEDDIARSIKFIETRTAQLPHLTITKKEIEKRIAERMIRVDNLRMTLQMIALCQELLEQERKREETPLRHAFDPDSNEDDGTDEDF